MIWSARITFDPSKEKIASALNLAGGSVIAVTGGYYGDAPTYQGHIAMIDRSSAFVTLNGPIRHSAAHRRHWASPPKSGPPVGE